MKMWIMKYWRRFRARSRISFAKPTPVKLTHATDVIPSQGYEQRDGSIYFNIPAGTLVAGIYLPPGYAHLKHGIRMPLPTKEYFAHPGSYTLTEIVLDLYPAETDLSERWEPRA